MFAAGCHRSALSARFLSMASLAVMSMGCAPASPQAPVTGDPWRPALHFAPPQHWMNDPNGPVTVGPLRHLFFQYNPRGAQWGHMSWGHASSTDLLSWQERDVAIPRTDSTLIFSGGVVRDSAGTSGLCRGERCLVAIYTAAHERTREQAQSLAYSSDGGSSWRLHDGNPVLSVGSTEFRDPWVFWHPESRRWVMAVVRSTEHMVEFYHSPNLREWQRAGAFGPAGATAGVWECPVLLRVPVENAPGQWRWMLKVDLNPGHPAGGSGAQYFVGDFDGARFTPSDRQTGAHWVEQGPDFYCAQPWTDHPVNGLDPWIGWMSNWKYAALTPTGRWRGAMTLPRTLQLREVEQRLRLVQRPIPALHGYRGVPRDVAYANENIPDVTPVPPSMWGAVLDMQLTIDPGEAAEVGLLLRRSDREHVLVAYDPVRRVIALDRRQSGDPALPDSVRRAFQSRHEAVRIRRDDRLVVRVVVDRSSVEVFADDGEVVLTALVFPATEATGVALFSKGGPVRQLRLRSWPLRAPSK